MPPPTHLGWMTASPSCPVVTTPSLHPLTEYSTLQPPTTSWLALFLVLMVMVAGPAGVGQHIHSLLLADLSEARGCSTNNVVID